MARSSSADMETKETCVNLLINLTFPEKLWHLVNDPQVCSICWDASGEEIIVYEQAFEAEVLWSHTRWINDYFKTKHFRSFIRQLNLYGFRKLHPRLDISEQQPVSSDMAHPHHFQNPNFKRDKPELLVNLKRLTPANKAKLAAGTQLTRRSSKHFHHVKFQKNSPVMRKVRQSCNPDSLDSKVPCSQQPAASPRGYYPGYSVAYPHSTNHAPGWKADDDPDSTKSNIRVNLDTVFKVADEMQAVASVRGAAKVTSDHMGRQLD
ncbi:hypothetical protein QTP70_021565 [Hemibagrus guttatus]|uniref:HSF-type DNA-binding domain-containing protein n=1 Tax=Hemibagrus guttatus TaxID=175788 RepID=A0AAE0Q6V0_9TELE|nr:hypothetical protein QTP70_021565 [Hemibagrus guttatus]